MSDAVTLAPPAPSSTPGAAPGGDHVVIDGVSIGFDDILNRSLTTPKKAAEYKERFFSAEPFPHIVFDGLFNPRLLELVLADFDRLKFSEWRRYDNSNELKRGSAPKTRLGVASQLYFSTIYSGEFVEFLEALTGIEGLIVDPELYAGGLHDIPSGGKFAMHIDFNQHSVTRLANRLVFITYLNRDWRLDYGGDLELWDAETRQRVDSVVPEFGRSVLFYQSSKSLHGHPNPVNAPNGRHRRSAAAYFYSNGRADGDGPEFHTTLFPTQALSNDTERLRNFAKYVLPPAAFDAARKVKSLLKK